MGGPFRPLTLGIRPLGAAPDVTFDDVTIDVLTVSSIVASGNVQCANLLTSADVIATGAVSSQTGLSTFINVEVGGTLNAIGAVDCDTSLNVDGPIHADGTIDTDTNLIVDGTSTLTGDIGAGNLNMASGKKVTLAVGSPTAVSLGFTGHAVGSGWSGATVDQILASIGGVSQQQLGASNALAGNTWSVTTQLLLSSAFRLTAKAVQTTGYQLTTSDAIVISNGVSLTHTMPATGGGSQMLFLLNIAATNATFARNGNTFQGAAADLVLIPGEGAIIQHLTGDYRILLRGGL